MAPPLLKATMAGLVRGVTGRQVVPGSARAENPQNGVQYGTPIPPGSSPYPSLRALQQGFQNRPLGIGEVHASGFAPLALKSNNTLVTLHLM